MYQTYIVKVEGNLTFVVSAPSALQAQGKSAKLIMRGMKKRAQERRDPKLMPDFEQILDTIDVERVPPGKVYCPFNTLADFGIPEGLAD